MPSKDIIIDFIFRRWVAPNSNYRDIWTNNNCYWFAHILTTRFTELSIYYDPVVGHFVAGNGSEFYDINGVYITENTLFLLNDIKEHEPSWYMRLLRDCIV